MSIPDFAKILANVEQRIFNSICTVIICVCLFCAMLYFGVTAANDLFPVQEWSPWLN